MAHCSGEVEAPEGPSCQSGPLSLLPFARAGPLLESRTSAQVSVAGMQPLDQRGRQGQGPSASLPPGGTSLCS